MPPEATRDPIHFYNLNRKYPGYYRLKKKIDTIPIPPEANTRLLILGEKKKKRKLNFFCPHACPSKKQKRKKKVWWLN